MVFLTLALVLFSLRACIVEESLRVFAQLICVSKENYFLFFRELFAYFWSFQNSQNSKS